MRITVVVPGSFRVVYKYRGKLGGRNRTLEDAVTVPCLTPSEAIAQATVKRGHLDMFKIVSAEPETETRNATRAEEFEAANAAFAALQAKRGKKV